jgi:hypothetical protein
METLRARVALLIRQRNYLLTIAGVGALVIAPQLAIYHQATGNLFISSYGNLGFYFTSPRIFGVLFSVQKGVFFWTPLLLLAVAGLAGLAHSQHSARAFVVPAAIFLVLNTYIIASWWDWQFGASFGHRAFVDALPIFAVGLAAFFQWSSVTVHRRRLVACVVVAAVALNVFQMLQYWNGVMPISDTTWEQYRGVFLKWR